MQQNNLKQQREILNTISVKCVPAHANFCAFDFTHIYLMCASTWKILCLDSFMLSTDLTSVSELSRVHPHCYFEHTMIAFLLQPGIRVSWLKLYTCPIVWAVTRVSDVIVCCTNRNDSSCWPPWNQHHVIPLKVIIYNSVD